MFYARNNANNLAFLNDENVHVSKTMQGKPKQKQLKQKQNIESF